MKSISRRIRRLEEKRFGTAADIEATRRLRERLEAGRRRVAQWGEQEGISVSDQDRENLSGLTVDEILHRGRARVAKAKAERDAVQREITG